MIYSGDLFMEANYKNNYLFFITFFSHICMDLLTHPRSHSAAAGMVTLTPHAVSGVIDHRQINIRSAGEQDRH